MANYFGPLWPNSWAPLYSFCSPAESVFKVAKIEETRTAAPLVATALTFGLTVLCLAASIGHVSGCHINPGVTVGLLANGKIDLIRAAVYIIAQMVGGVAGAALLSAILPSGADNLCPTKLSIGISPLQGIIVEGFIVFLLVFVVCNVCESNSTLAPVTIGLAVTVGHIFAVSLHSPYLKRKVCPNY